MPKNMSDVNTKYAVKLSIMANSFYDPFSKANLFKSRPYYLFDHEPTEAILVGVKHGKLTDLKGNIGELEMMTGFAELTPMSIDEGEIAKIRAEITSEVKAEIEAEVRDDLETKIAAEVRAELELEFAEKTKALEAKEASVEKEAEVAKEPKKTAKGKGSDK